MKWLLNISTQADDMALFTDNWAQARTFATTNGFSGYELYPVAGYPFERIPADLIVGLHLRIVVILAPFWRANRAKLLEIFGDAETIRTFYGGVTRDSLVESWRQQLTLATHLGCDYVVFHIADANLAHLYDWQFPWSWTDTIDLCADIINAVTAETSFQGDLLFENLWWPGSLRLDSPAEVERLLARVRYPRCGLMLDTGHVLNKNQMLQTEADGIAYLLDTVQRLGAWREVIKGVHLTRSLSAEYVRQSQTQTDPYAGATTFWERFDIARRHVLNIDQHDAFDDPNITRLFESIQPSYGVFEFHYRNRAEWQAKITRQWHALRTIRSYGSKA